MTEMAKGSVTHQRLIALLSQEGADFRVVTHEAVGKCEAVSEIRGTALGQGAKALVCKVKGNGVNQHVLAILAADQQADLSQLASHIGGLRASLASPAEVDELTGCVFGAIPPFSFHVIVSVHKWQFDDSSPDFLCKKRKDFLLPSCSKRKVSRLIIFWQGNHDV